MLLGAMVSKFAELLWSCWKTVFVPPWPELWVGFDQILDSACESGLVLNRSIKATEQTFPTYWMIAPDDQNALPPQPAAGSLMRWLHREGYLSYLCLAFTKA
jgi:hypothetical protein